MLNVKQLRELVIQPSLQQIGLYSPEVEELLVGTALVESGLIYIAQIPNPVARGLWMMEQPTYKDLRVRLVGNKGLMQRILDFLWMDDLPVAYNYLSYNLAASCIFARLKYLSIIEPIPKPATPEVMAQYWSAFYNTRNLDTDKARFIQMYNKYAGE